ncbi:glucose dehydrogenase [FAD, quinone]-like [Galleria mellonella]|uniref:Glucose dehydrogenase [FAD, quinone]-like n=1 Tax=Galleria mellonella TaxID=7137 RepID=A0ABM3MXU6_GALME|nr:glucose dehydrogenase [FAD, quinone]-like [Galleria mellonella]
MINLKKTVIILIVASFFNALNAELDDDYITIESEDNNEIEFKSKLDINPRKGKILWPYPVNYMSEDETNEKNNSSQHADDNKKREQRFLRFSYPQSPIVDLMMQTVGINYSPHTNDPFEFLRDSYPLPKGYSQPLDEYDYIIVGAGAAGSVLASRLTEDKPRAMVLVLEAGKPEMLLSDIPALALYLQRTDYTWQYSMEHQPGVCLGSEEQRCFWPRGKAVGGTSVTNLMLYTRGRPQDWDRIAADGNYGWSYNDVLYYYKKSERAELKKYKNAEYRGREGELTVENIPFKTGLVEAFLQSGRDFGHPTVDYNAPDQFGFGYAQTTTNKGHRLSSAKAFLHPHKRRRNLHILSETRATKVLIEPQTKRAYAVEYIRNGIKYTARCRREVVLSAGPIASPQLLILSGVGPREHLENLGIPVVADLKVGRTLYDHIAFPGVIFKLNTTNASLLEPKVATLPNLMQWLQFGDGLLTTPGLIEALGYIKTSQSEDVELVPDIALVSMGGSITADAGGATRKAWRISDKTYYTAFGPLSGSDTWSAVPLLLQPKSKGYLELRDNNPYSYPKLYGNYLTDPKDMATLKEAVKYIIRLGESEAFKKYNPKLFLPEYPTCKNHAPGSDSYWECAIRTMLITVHHQIATCKMGPASDPYAVVDPELRVYGIGGLRVVDSSIIPRPTSAHTNAPAIMIGEKGADLIKNTWLNVVS